MTSRLLLRAAAERGGPKAVERALSRAGLAGDAARLHSLRGRVSYEVKLRLFDAVAAEVGDPRIGLALADAALTDPALAALRGAVRALGSPATVLRQVSRISTRFDTAAVFRCTESSDRRAELVWRVLAPHRPSRMDCDYNIGLLMQAPVLFGLPPARVEHLACQVDGASACTYTVTWHPLRSTSRWRRRRRRPQPVVQTAACHGDEQLRALREASDALPADATLEATLQRITEQADRVVHGPGHLLDVRLPHGARHLRARGLGRALLQRLGDTRLEPGVQQMAEATVIAVPVATATASYGALAVVLWPGQELLAQDVELLTGYARQAAAALQTAALLDQAREQEETARLLLAVARSLAGRSSIPHIAQTIADAVPALCGADRSAVALWEPGAQSVWMAGLAGWPAELADRAAAFVATTEDSPELCQLVASGAPLLVDRSSSAWALDVLDAFGVAAFVAVPVQVDGNLVGIILAHWVDRAPPRELGEALSERLWGLAGLAGVALDKTRLLEELDHRSSHDELTGLPNRAVFDARLQAALEDAAAGGAPVTVLLADVDRLKRINDGLGREAGDRVLRQVASRLTATVREGDTVTREGDEFIMLLPGVGPRRAEQIAHGIRTALQPPVSAGDEAVFVGLTIGTAVVSGRSLRRLLQQPEAACGLVEQATANLWEAKRRSAGALVPGPRSPERLRLETELHGAVDRGEIQVFFQPQIDVATGRTVAVEALARWQHPVLGAVPPGRFVPVAEDSGLIRELGAHVLRRACRTVADWSLEGLELEVAVNVSAAQLTDADFSDVVQRVLAETGLPPERLVLEVTESQVMTEVADRHGHLTRLRSTGIGISIDDFGTGFSSLAQLNHLPATELKIDRSFVDHIPDDRPSPLVAGIVGLAHGLGLRVVAEGIETPGQLQAVRGIGCDRAQGYLLGRPAEPDAVHHASRPRERWSPSRSPLLPSPGSWCSA
ncbi:putative bifunctional diguanylate cyclase/phosphodiesterase [Geodermatophilus sp. SYSU D01062]